MHWLYETKIDILSVLMFIITLGALVISIYQSKLSRASLNAAIKSINEDKRSRQLSMLPKYSWVIEVQVMIERWISELEKIKQKTLDAKKHQNIELIKEAARAGLKQPMDVAINKSVYDNLPDSLREIMMAGAQYYYNTMAPISHLWTEAKGPDWNYASSIQERIDDSIYGLNELKKLIAEMIPTVILNTPATLSDKDFIR